VAEYVPLPLSTTAPIVPALVPPAPSENATLAPPEPIVAPDASFVVSVIVAVEPEAIVALDIVTVEVAGEGSAPSPPVGSVPPLQANTATIQSVNEKRAARSRGVAADIIRRLGLGGLRISFAAHEAARPTIEGTLTGASSLFLAV
jgi:hypothetical protein